MEDIKCISLSIFDIHVDIHYTEDSLEGQANNNKPNSQSEASLTYTHT